MALGAAPTQVMRMWFVMARSFAVIGIVIGLGGAFALTRLLQAMLFGVSVTDALTFAAAPAGIILVPEFRATRICAISTPASETTRY